MAWSEHLGAMNAAVFPEVGDQGFWTPGPSTPVWIVLIEPEIILGVGQGGVIASQRILEVQCCEIPEPRERDQVAIGTRRFVLIAEPTKSDDGSCWRCEAREQA
jgi:hypothetical protein